MEILFILLAILGSVLLFAGPVLGIVAFVLVLKLRRETRALQAQVKSLSTPKSTDQPPVDSAPKAEQPSVESAPQEELSEEPVAAGAAKSTSASTWETFLGTKALGWVAVGLLLIGAAFFLRYAFENNWIGPMGQVSFGLILGTSLVGFGRREYARGWTIFCQIVTAAGLLLLYLASFASFGYYSILSQEIGALGLVAISVLGAVLAAVYNMRVLAVMTVLGAFSVPLLMASPIDQYQQLFLYLTAVNLSVLLITYLRQWSVVSFLSLAGTQGVFWLWYFTQYHPEKLPWALGFQLAIFLLFLGHSFVAHVLRDRSATLLDLICLPTTAFAWFIAAYVLLQEDYRPWLGTLAMVTGIVYVLWARITVQRGNDTRQTLVALATAIGFLTIAFPIQLDAQWVALCWAAEATALWWFGLRVGYPLRCMAAVLAVMAVHRVLFIDLFTGPRETFFPVFNIHTGPALLVAACLLGSVRVALHRWNVLSKREQKWVRIASLGGIALVWVILSVEVVDYFDAYAVAAETDAQRWRWLGQMALSGFWAIYASLVLAVGFITKRATLRWTALALYALTIGKVLLVDIDHLAELYRIAAFVVVAIILALAAWAYQRFTAKDQSAAEEST